MFTNYKSIEEKFIQKLLFSNSLPERSILDKLDFEKLIKLSSSHLLIPLIYFKINQKNIESYFPDDFIDFVKKIYEINFNRNEELISETKKLSELLKKNLINFKFLKGSFLINKNYYEDIGIRMIGDIDFLVNIKDMENVSKLLNSVGYFSRYKYKLWKTKHSPRFISEKKLFAIEPHSEILIYRKRKLIDSKKIIYQKKLDKLILKEILILNYMINDYGYLKATLSYRSIYDVVNLTSRKEKEIFFLKNKYVKRFYLMTNLLSITNYKINLNFSDKVFKYRFILKRNSKLFFILDNFFCKSIELTPIILMQFVEFIVNKEYRKNSISVLKRIVSP